MADSTAARKQAEGAARHVEGMYNKDSKVGFVRTSRRIREILLFVQTVDPKDLAASSGVSGRFIDPKEHDAEIAKYKKGR